MDKQCSECKEIKPLHEFYTKQRKDVYPTSVAGVSSDCRNCARIKRQVYVRKNPSAVRNTHLKRMYGITLDDYNVKFMAQNGCCAGCGKHQSELDRILAVDHNHDTKQVRGLLCASCNIALGMLQEDIGILTNLVSYLNSYSELAASNTNVVSLSPKKVG